jgi:RNA polymerase sigma factor for flagellar operon FliA
MDEQQEGEFWKKVRQDKNAPESSELIEHYTYLAKKSAVHYYRMRTSDDIEFNDYLQLAMLGLVESVQRYDPDKGASFSTFANYRIKGALLNGLEKTTELRDQIAFFRRSRRARISSITDRDVNGKDDNFSKLVSVTIELALSFMLEDAGFLIQEQPGGDELYDRESARLLSNQLNEIIDLLPENERLLIRNHYFHAMSFEEIARLFGVTKGRISQLHKRALTLIRTEYDSKNQELDTKL